MFKRRMSCSFGEPPTKMMKRDMSCREYGMACVIGERSENQDAVLARRDPFSIFAVFDGHGKLGKLASERAKAITETSLSQYSTPETKEASEQIIRTLISTIDEELVSTGKEKNVDFGTTATIAIPYGKGLLSGVVIGNVGDSDALVIREGSKLLTLDNLHRVENNPSEQKRIKAEGGVIWKSRVIPGLGRTKKEICEKSLTLAISRALGHFILRDYGVSASPEFKDIPLSEDDILIIASDGIWDALKAKFVAKMISGNKSVPLDSLCQKLCNFSLLTWKSKQRIADNMSIVIAQF